jgi:hypothetical protein
MAKRLVFELFLILHTAVRTSSLVPFEGIARMIAIETHARGNGAGKFGTLFAIDHG